MERKTPKILYHYCSIETFVKIIETQKLRFSDITKSNDTYEITYLWEQYYDYLKKQSNKLANSFSRFTISQQLEVSKFVVACFSEKKDSLHLWTSYASDGISIGFDAQQLDEWTKQICFHVDSKNSVKNETYFGELAKVEYYNKRNVKKFIAEQCSKMKYTLDNFGEIFKKAPFAKTDFFECESEWRIVLPIIYNNTDKINFDYTYHGNVLATVLPKDEKKGIFENCLTYDIPFPKNMISEVYLSPRCKFNPNEIKDLLMLNGFNFDKIKIKKSIGSFR